jgi:phage terminase small subunit
MPRLVAVKEPGLTELQLAYVKARGTGLGQTAAARAAGYAAPEDAGKDLEKNPRVRAAVEEERRRYAEVADLTRREVIEGIKDGILAAKARVFAA